MTLICHKNAPTTTPIMKKNSDLGDVERFIVFRIGASLEVAQFSKQMRSGMFISAGNAHKVDI